MKIDMSHVRASIHLFTSSTDTITPEGAGTFVVAPHVDIWIVLMTMIVMCYQHLIGCVHIRLD
jgi:hypothetical protein